MTSVPEQAPRWLDDTEMRVWRSFLETNRRVASAINDGLKGVEGMTLDDYEVLVYLSESEEERLRMSDLSQCLQQSQSRLTQRVDRLVKQGLVCREKCPNDRRGTFACLTPAGRQRLEAAAPHHVNDVRAAFIDHLEPDEQIVLAQVFERVAERLRNSDG